jgi:hypothetical protein
MFYFLDLENIIKIYKMPPRKCYSNRDDDSSDDEMSCNHNRFCERKYRDCFRKKECHSSDDTSSETSSRRYNKCSNCKNHKNHIDNYHKKCEHNYRICYHKSNSENCNCNKPKKERKNSNSYDSDVEYYTKKECQNGKVVLITIN